MVEKENKFVFMDVIKAGLSNISQIISASILSPIVEGTDMVIRNIEQRIILIEKRVLRKITNLLIIGFGGILLIFALFFFLKEYLGWSHSAAFFAIGITVFVIGLLLKLGETKR